MGASILASGMGAMAPDVPDLQYKRSDVLQAMCTREAGAVGAGAVGAGAVGAGAVGAGAVGAGAVGAGAVGAGAVGAGAVGAGAVGAGAVGAGAVGSAGTGSGGTGAGGAVAGQVGGSDGTGGMGGIMDGRVQWPYNNGFGLDACFQPRVVCTTDAEENQCRGGAEEWCAREERGEGRHESEAGGLEHDVHDECGTEDEWLPRSQGIRSGSAPDQRIKRRSMAERRRRERISEGLQRLRVKVRGRGDTCAMLDRAVGYVDALERRVMELERVIMTAACSRRNIFPGNSFAGGAFAGRGFAGSVFVNNAAELATIPAALASVPTGLGNEPWLDRGALV
ncbi:unnamed protein product [Closterium sp. Yama58-4]|nr:unnamed protein product [Closterium sp. Yama58-4]